MGLDTIELILDVEQTFGVSIPDEDAQRMCTVGDIYQFLMDHCPLADDAGHQVCLTAAAFYHTRRGLCDVAEADRRKVRPGTQIAELLPTRTRREGWRRLAEALAVPLPDLRRPVWLSRLLFYGPLGAIAISAIYLAIERPAQLRDGWPALAIWGLYLGVEGYLGTRQCAVRIPRGFDTAGDLARTVLSGKASEFHGHLIAWHHRELWHTLVRIISTCLDVEPSRVTPEATIVGDLGAG
jgi:acyl carrier protein